MIHEKFGNTFQTCLINAVHNQFIKDGKSLEEVVAYFKMLQGSFSTKTHFKRTSDSESENMCTKVEQIAISALQTAKNKPELPNAQQNFEIGNQEKIHPKLN